MGGILSQASERSAGIMAVEAEAFALSFLAAPTR